MADSIHQKIIGKIDTRFKAILIAGGYATNMGNNVFEWRETPLAATELPGLIYRDPREERIPGCGVYDLSLQIEIDLFSTSPAGIRSCLADIERAVFVDETWETLAQNSEIDSSEMEVAQKENIFTASKVIMTVEYRTIRGDPYTQA